MQVELAETTEHNAYNLEGLTNGSLKYDLTLFHGNVSTIKSVFPKVYRLNGNLYEDRTETVTATDDQFVEYELHIRTDIMDMDSEVDSDRESNNSVEDEDSPDTSKHLLIYLQPVPNGFIINSNVYLTHDQWHTLTHVEEACASCIVCGVPVEARGTHVDSAAHARRLARAPPLRQFDLSITRMIRDTYHCGVCNIVYGLNEVTEHELSKCHEEKLLSSINKVVDILYELSMNKQKNDAKINAYHFDANALNTYNGGSSVSGSTCSDYDDDDNGSENNGTALPLGISYATMARKPKRPELPKFVKIHVSNKKFNIRSDSWHMIIKIELNKFYCMVCQHKDLIRYKTDHCVSTTHKDRLDQCLIVQIYEDFVIRAVDDKLYHCGQCNNLQFKSDIDIHVERAHPKKAKNLTEITAPSTRKNSDRNNGKGNNGERQQTNVSKTTTEIKIIPSTSSNNGNYLPGKQSSDSSATNSSIKYENNDNNDNDGDNGTEYTDNGDDIYRDIDLYPFGNKLKIPFISYNIILKTDDEFFCCLCNMECTDIVEIHTQDLVHIQLMQMTPFIKVFSCNLIRAVRGSLHCAICNVLIAVKDICEHNLSPSHTTALSKSLTNQKDINEKISKASTIKTTEQHNDTQNPTWRPPIPNSPTYFPPQHYMYENPRFNNNLYPSVRPNYPNQLHPFMPYPEFHPQSMMNPNPYIMNLPNQGLQPHMPLQSNTEKCHSKENSIKQLPEINNNKRNSISESNIQDFDMSIDNSNDLDMSLDTSILDTSECVIVRLKSLCFKITITSYNTLVPTACKRYCFVCSSLLDNEELKKHIDSRAHAENLSSHKFIEKFEEHLLRQEYLKFHCGLCNVIITKNDLNSHLTWPQHESLYKKHKQIKKSEQKYLLQSQLKAYTMSTQKEAVYRDGKVPKLTILHRAKITESDGVNGRLKKIIIANDNVYKVSFDKWNSVFEVNGEVYCIICQVEADSGHFDSLCHKEKLELQFDEKYAKDLIRKIDNFTANCVVCNAELNNEEKIIKSHIIGLAHINNHKILLKNSACTETYADCYEDVLIIS